MLHVLSIYLHLPYKSTIHVGKYIPYVDGIGLGIGTSKETSFTRNDIISTSCVLVWAAQQSVSGPGYFHDRFVHGKP